MNPDVVRQRWAHRGASEFQPETRAEGRMAAISRAAERVNGWTGPGDIVLDVGCGVGLLATQLQATSVVGLDGSSSLLALAKARMAVVEADLFALPLRRGSVAVTCCMFVLDDYDESMKEKALRVLASTVKPGGRLLVAGYAPDDERMGPRRQEASVSGTDVFLEGASYYAEVLERIAGQGPVIVEHVRTTGTVKRRTSGQSTQWTTMERHFIIGSVQTGADLKDQI